MFLMSEVPLYLAPGGSCRVREVVVLFQQKLPVRRNLLRECASKHQEGKSDPLRAAHLSRHKWPGGLVN